MNTPESAFDDLSHRWQQQAPTASPDTDWRALLARGSHSPVARMLRNVWAELVACVVLAAPLLVGLLRWHHAVAAALAAGLAGLIVASLYYYYRQISALHRLRAAGDTLGNHAAAQLRQLRQLLRLNHRAALVLTAVAAGLVLYGAARYVLPELPAEATGRFVVWLALTVVASFAITHWCIRWHSYYAYGQHLTRLETVLRELGEK